MTRELDVQYSGLCQTCRRFVLNSNKDLIQRLLSRFSIREVSKLTGIPKTTLARFRMSESICKRTSGIKPTDTDKTDILGINHAELSKSIHRLGQKQGVNNGRLE